MSRRYEIDTLNKIVIPSEARDPQFAARCRSLASLGMTNPWKLSLDARLLPRRVSGETNRQLQHVGSQHASCACFGFTARTKALMYFSSTCAAIASTSMPEEERNSRASATR